jgi:hypothetical protein
LGLLEADGIAAVSGGKWLVFFVGDAVDVAAFFGDILIVSKILCALLH